MALKFVSLSFQPADRHLAGQSYIEDLASFGPPEAMWYSLVAIAAARFENVGPSVNSFEMDPDIFTDDFDVSEFREVWWCFQQWAEGCSLITRHSKNCFRAMYDPFFRSNNIPFPEIIDVETFLKQEGHISPDANSYEKIAKELGMESIDYKDPVARAVFTGRAFAKCLSREDVSAMRYFTQFTEADFVEWESRKPVERFFERKGGDERSLQQLSCSELLKRPRETRFANTYVSFTGTLKTDNRPKIERKEAMRIVESLGGISADSKDKRVTHLVVGIQRTGNEGKEKEFKGSGVVIVSAEEFFKLIGD